MDEIIWHDRARKQFKKISAHYREAIFQHVEKPAEEDLTLLDIKELKNHRYQYRMRVSR